MPRFLLFKEVFMKRILSIFVVLTLLLTALPPITTYAEGEGNIDNGSGDMGSGTSENFWNPGERGGAGYGGQTRRPRGGHHPH